MIKIILRVSLFIAGASISCSSSKVQQPFKDSIAITGAFIIPMDEERVISNKTILIKEGIIYKLIDAGEKIPSEFKTVSAKGKFIIPGLSDMHIHLRDTAEFTSYLRYGVTTVLHMSGPMANATNLESYREQIKSGVLTGPNFYFTSPLVEGAQMNFPGVSTSLITKESVINFVNEVKTKKYDFIKMYETIDSTLYFFLLEEANKNGIHVIGHTPRNVNPTKVLEDGQKMIAHSEEFFFDFFDCRNCGKEKFPDTNKIAPLLLMLKEHNTWVTPNLSFVFATRSALTDAGKLLSDEEVKYLPPVVYNAWKTSDPNNRQNLEQFKERELVKYPFLQHLVKRLYLSKVPLLAGTDASLIGLPPGKSLIQELFELSKAGIPNYGCLEAATKNPGIFINSFAVSGKDENFGQIKAGYRADLLILDQNPLMDLKNLLSTTGIVIRGRFFMKADLDQKRKVFR